MGSCEVPYTNQTLRKGNASGSSWASTVASSPWASWGLFNTVVRIQGVVGFVAFHTPVVGDFIPFVGPQFLGHLVRHFYVFIDFVPLKNSFKLMVVICNSSVQMVG